MTTTLAPPPVSATPGQVRWLEEQVRSWQADGLLRDDQAAAILGRYTAARRLSLARLLLTIGACFVGVGLIWLVAANIDALAPTWRFVAVAAIWLALLAGAEVLHTGRRSPALVGAARLLASLAFGAMLFQAAQSLQVPAYEPLLLGCWALGALVHAYVVDAVLPLVVGIGAGTIWLGWQVGAESESLTATVTALAAAGLASVSLGVLHLRRRPSFAPAWREAGALLTLAALFAAALPLGDTGGWGWATALVVGCLLATGATVAALVTADGHERLEPLGAAVVALAAVVLLAWDAGQEVSGPAVAHSLLSIVVYVAAAVGVAVLGTLHDSWRLTATATVALVGFTTMQGFAVFAEILQGAWLFLLLGLVLVGTGWLFDRARRGIAAAITEQEAGA